MDFRKDYLRIVEKIKSKGYIWFCKRIVRRFLDFFLPLILLPVSLLLHLIGFRRVNVAIEYVGHLASEPDCLLKAIQLKLLPPRIYYIIAPKNRAANECLLKYWKEHIIIIQNPFLGYLFNVISNFGLIKYDVVDFIQTQTSRARYYDVNSMWGNRSPLLKISENHKEMGRKVLEGMGMPRDAWFVCLHVRESGFAPETADEHAYRNANIQNYYLAIDTIISLGGWVIRVGDATMKPIPEKFHCIDYARSAVKSDWMDVFLCSECKLFIGNTSGLFLISTVFGVSCALVNVVPFSAQSYGINDVYIPKLLKDKKTNKYLSALESLESPSSQFRDSESFRKMGLELEENLPEDIDELVRESLDRMNGNFSFYMQNIKEQSAFKSLFRREHYGFGSASSIGVSFLKKYYTNSMK